jgi:DNA modification methylase
MPSPRPGPAVTRPGDLWQIGPHRLICGDATNLETSARLLDGERAQMIFTDPPYNVKIDGHVSGLGAVKHREFAVASGEMSQAEFTAFLERVFANLVLRAADGAIHFVCMDWRHLGEVLAAGHRTFAELKNICVWNKTNGGMGSLYRSQHEMVFVFKSGKAPHINNVELGRHGRYRTNVWTYAGANVFSATREADLAMHPTVKPVALVADAILDCSKRKGIILDAFAGSGTTLVAADRTGRRGYGIELDPIYCDTILKRVADVARVEARLAATGQTFAVVAAERLHDGPGDVVERESAP